MKTYLSIKLTEAEPMTSAEFNARIGRTAREGENLNEEGYLVKYPDGYEGWCPKPQFEAANLEISGPNILTMGDAERFENRSRHISFAVNEERRWLPFWAFLHSAVQWGRDGLS